MHESIDGTTSRSVRLILGSADFSGYPRIAIFYIDSPSGYRALAPTYIFCRILDASGEHDDVLEQQVDIPITPTTPRSGSFEFNVSQSMEYRVSRIRPVHYLHSIC